MKQIDNMTKKAYKRPAIKVVALNDADIICTSEEEPSYQPSNYDGELD